jgi:2-polyprenyl-6-hydroxyphenyl methylase/3-demethylubiquinone-9 3-methyltransferase
MSHEYHEYEYGGGQLACSSRYLLPILNDIISSLSAGSVVMDLGCGNGSVLATFRDRGLSLHGIEKSQSGVREAHKTYPDIDIALGDVASDLSNHELAGRCDLVLNTEVIEHVYQPRVLVKNFYLLARPGGMLVVSTPYHGYLKNVVLAIAGRMDSHFTALWDHGHVKFWSKQTLCTILREGGFECTDFRGAGRYPYLWKSMVVVASKPARG